MANNSIWLLIKSRFPKDLADLRTRTGNGASSLLKKLDCWWKGRAVDPAGGILFITLFISLAQDFPYPIQPSSVGS